MMITRLFAGFGLLLTAGLLAACGGSSAAPAVTPTPTFSQAWMPQGYEEVQPGIGIRWARQYGTEFDCPAYGESCFGVELVSNTSCPNGIYIELALVDDAGTIRGMTNEMTAAVRPGDHLVLGIASEKSPKARVADVQCL